MQVTYQRFYIGPILYRICYMLWKITYCCMPTTALLFIYLVLTNFSGWLLRLLPQPLHTAGLCFIVSSTLLQHARVVPSCPGCPPAFLSVGSRKLWFFLGRFWSCDGGIWLLLLFFLFFKRAFSASRVFTLTSNCSIFCSNVCMSA